MNILGIETSCDETSASVIKDGTTILSNVTTSSINLHKKTKGIIPEIAAREQIKYLLPTIAQALKESSLTKEDIDAIAVTSGPGLIGSLLVGVETAKTLSVLWDKPLIPVNHLVAHIYANWFSYPPPTFPLIALVVSGGHTDLVILKSHTKIKRLGGTRDDAAGEAFDKCARLLSLGYPGGPAISKAAEKFHSKNKKKKLDLFPRPMINEKNFDFSFSGLKTAVLNYTKSSSTKDDTNHIAAEIQEAIVDSLIEKSISSIKKYKPTCFLLAGGVSANKRLREKLKARIQEENMWIGLHVSSVNLCTDNAAPIASCAFFRNKKVSPFSLSPNPQFSIANPSF